MKRESFVTQSRKIVTFQVDKRIVSYFDEIWRDGIQVLPKDTKIMLKLLQSRNKDMKMIAALIMDANKGENKKEYDSCKSEQELIDFITKECVIKGLLRVK